MARLAAGAQDHRPQSQKNFPVFDPARAPLTLWASASFEHRAAPLYGAAASTGGSKGVLHVGLFLPSLIFHRLSGDQRGCRQREGSPRYEELAGFIQELVTVVKGEPSSWPLPANLRREGVRLRNCPLVSGWADTAMTAGHKGHPSRAACPPRGSASAGWILAVGDKTSDKEQCRCDREHILTAPERWNYHKVV